MTKTITVDIDETGNVEIDAAGFEGRSCREATAALEEALGVTKQRTEKRTQTRVRAQVRAGGKR